MARLGANVNSNGGRTQLSHISAPKASSTSRPSPQLDTLGRVRATFQVPGEEIAISKKDQGVSYGTDHAPTSQKGIFSEL